MLAALLNARQTGVGQVVDAAIVDGAAHLSATFFGLIAGGIWQQGRGNNLVDGGAPFYDCYRCSDGKRSEEHTSELQSLMRISYAVFCLKKKKNNNKQRKQ